ncbi:MAG: glycosyltransferase family 2 protein [Saprospiraceae bacterium]|nr:glycosyltransferase family 2 protein [Saprospiraceae bacterium]
MTFLYYFIFGVYSLALGYITLYCVMQFHLLYHYKKYHYTHKAAAFRKAEGGDSLPFVTIQLPVFNELYVVERLIDNILLFDYPKDRYEIHILDDSTDETVDIVAKKVAEYKALGFQIQQIQRADRKGFKAGALKDAMPYAKGEFIAIFDADFLPRPDFLRTTIAYFDQPEVGVVQTRWEHINQDYSLITRLQAMQLNVHFTVEQQGRRAGNYMLQFNGTAGVWRRTTIEDAGGWEADTLTEDLDLSIRAQLKGWRIVYLEKFGSPAELPSEMIGLRSQQFRWMKGGAETARKMLPTVWRSALSTGQKIHATLHLLASTIFVFIFIAGVLSVPLLFILPKLSFDAGWLSYALIGMLSVLAIYYVANVQAELKTGPWIKRLLKFILLFPVFLSLSMGLSLHNSVAVVQGYLGRKSPFVRTPKFNIQGLTDTFQKTKYRGAKISWVNICEGLLALYFGWAVIVAIQSQNLHFVLFHLLLGLGFGSIFYFTLLHMRVKH